MDQKLLLKEKDYELLASKRTVQFKHSFNDPLINPPRKKQKPSRNIASASALSKDANPLANNILSRANKTVRAPAAVEQKAAVEEEIDGKVESTPWSTILNLFVRAYDHRKEPLEVQIANVHEK